MNDTKKKILIQLDPDAQASAFDRVVAVDGGAEHVFAFSGVTLEQVTPIVHGAIFTRGAADLRSTAIFVGGVDVAAGEAILRRVTDSFFGPMRVSVMLDSNGANTTAAAAVLAARKHLDLTQTTALVLAGTGPVGQRAARMLAGSGAKVRLASRSLKRAQEAAKVVSAVSGGAAIAAVEASDDASVNAAVKGVDLVIAAGAAGVKLLPLSAWAGVQSLKVVIDLNAVPPLGIEGVEATDKAKDRQGRVAYGALGVGGTKMKIHKAAIASLFESNDKVLDAEAIFELGKGI